VCSSSKSTLHSEDLFSFSTFPIDKNNVDNDDKKFKDNNNILFAIDYALRAKGGCEMWEFGLQSLPDLPPPVISPSSLSQLSFSVDSISAVFHWSEKKICRTILLDTYLLLSFLSFLMFIISFLHLQF
jgi:hypothetical protein